MVKNRRLKYKGQRSWFPHYGNYVGPYWSNGAVQASVDSYAPGFYFGAVDDFDETARLHDAQYARYAAGDRRVSLSKADFQFAKANLFKGKTFKERAIRTAAGAAVGLQGGYRRAKEVINRKFLRRRNK